MAVIAEYVLSVTGAAMVCAVVLRLLEGKGSGAAVAKLLTGIFMAVTVLSPITQLRLSDFGQLLPEISADAQAAVMAGEASAQEALRDGISAQAEAYILEKAAQLGAVLSVSVELSEDALPVPVRVRLQGSIAPYARQRLQSILTEDLGIDKENQIWT